MYKSRDVIFMWAYLHAHLEESICKYMSVHKDNLDPANEVVWTNDAEVEWHERHIIA